MPDDIKPHKHLISFRVASATEITHLDAMYVSNDLRIAVEDALSRLLRTALIVSPPTISRWNVD